MLDPVERRLPGPFGSARARPSLERQKALSGKAAERRRLVSSSSPNAVISRGSLARFIRAAARAELPSRTYRDARKLVSAYALNSVPAPRTRARRQSQIGRAACEERV